MTSNGALCHFIVNIAYRMSSTACWICLISLRLGRIWKSCYVLLKWAKNSNSTSFDCIWLTSNIDSGSWRSICQYKISDSNTILLFVTNKTTKSHINEQVSWILWKKILRRLFINMLNSAAAVTGRQTQQPVLSWSTQSWELPLTWTQEERLLCHLIEKRGVE